MSQKSGRLLKIYALLKQKPVTIDSLKQWALKNNIAISERTFYRDLQTLEEAVLTEGEQIIVTTGEKNKKTWKIEFHGDDRLTEFDITSYLLFQKFLPLPLVQSRAASLERIREIFYKTYSKSRFEDFAAYSTRQLFSTGFGQFTGEESYSKTLEDMIWSIRNHREIELLKTQFDITSISQSVHFPLTFFPLKLIYHRGVVHLGGYTKNGKKLLILAMSQIKTYRLSNSSFNCAPLLKDFETEMQNRFGITENQDENIYDIELEFSEMLGSFVKNDFWHPTQKFKQKKNGNITMKMHCGINRELVGWIFMWMTNVRVVKPQLLKDLVLDKYREVLNDYETDKPLVSNNSFRAK
ncbi:WYL domain-containing protein [Chryseobacterium taklimakanense]|uniref:helix-turn-helix transcriptional regulator n=1 Tax=Chryseobacterium taklimakanense TaxID=536441 RepID=UPI001EF4391A|nr:WYL domain-containing protein [Chryseobacterium taklimakanense]MCG7280951.1 WYL domain-containing protein [Chryseobacterium taklimakanense]